MSDPGRPETIRRATLAPSDTDLPVEPKRADMSLGELLSEMTTELGTLFHQELELAKVEAKDELGRTKQAATMFAVAGVGALLALAMLSTALAWWLDEALHPAVAFALVGLLWVLIAGGCAVVGRDRVRTVEVLPETKESIKEDVEWARTQRS